MEENEIPKEQSINTDELKNETVNTVKQVKETMKNVDVKEEAKVTKGFVTEMFKNPFGKIKEIATDTTNQYFKTALILTIVWMITRLIAVIELDIFSNFSFSYLGKILLLYLKVTIAPAVLVIVMSGIILLMNKKSKKSLTTVISTVVAAKLPIIVANVLSLLTIISLQISTVTSKISSLATMVSAVLLYFAIRELYGEENENENMKNFVVINAIYFLASIVISLLGIYI